MRTLSNLEAQICSGGTISTISQIAASVSPVPTQNHLFDGGFVIQSDGNGGWVCGGAEDDQPWTQPGEPTPPVDSI